MSASFLAARFTWLSLTPLLLTAVPSIAAAEDGSTLTEAELFATFNSIGIRASVTGDQNEDASVTAVWRHLGEADFHAAHDLLPLPGGEWASSIFFLDAATEYEVLVTLDDPDNDTLQQRTITVRTREEGPPQQAGGRAIHVQEQQGRPGNPGTWREPLASIGDGLALASPGDTVLVHAGTYRETVKVKNSGAPDAPIFILADDTEGPVVVSGVAQQLETEARWSELRDGIFWTLFDESCDYLAAGRTRIYDYSSFEELDQEAAGLSGGFYVSEEEQRLYLRLPDRSDPSNLAVHCAIKDRAFVLDGAENIVIDGFRIRHFGGVAIDLYDSYHIWVRNNYIHHTGGGVRIRYHSSENVVENNWIMDTSVYNWPWLSVKWHTPEQIGISVGGGWGNVIRGNLVQGVFNGIYLGRWGEPDREIAAEMDVHDNLILCSGDDAFEPEGACVNQRLWGNASIGSHNAVSISPVEVGPVWVVRNLLVNFKDHAFKINGSPEGWMLLYHNTALPHENGSDAQPIAPPDPFGGLISRNNIYCGRRYALEYAPTNTLGMVDLDYDNMWSSHTTGSGHIVKWLDVRYEHVVDFAQATGQEVHGYEEKPLFSAPQEGDFSLAVGSPLLDAGVVIPGINELGCPDGPDLGAVENGGPEPLSFGLTFQIRKSARFFK
jgi:hypothetical protein